MLGWIGAIGFVLAIRTSSFSYWRFGLGASAGFFVGFAWFYEAILRFTGWGPSYCLAAFVLFSGYGSLQMVLAAYLSRSLDSLRLFVRVIGPALAWSLSECLFIRPIDWMLGYTQSSWLTFIQIADVGGPILVSFLMMLVAALILELFNRERSISRKILVAAISVVLVLGNLQYGEFRLASIDQLVSSGESIRIGIVAGDTPPSRTFDPQLMKSYSQRYGALARMIGDREIDLLFMPESTIWESFLDLPHSERDAFLLDRNLRRTVPIMTGAVAIQQLEKSPDASGSNAVVLILPEAADIAVYEKQLPFPIAEGDLFPSLSWFWGLQTKRERSNETFEVSIKDRIRNLKVLPLICFESISSLFVGQRVARSEPDVLVEFSNHSWFPGVITSMQHRVFARWRAIENRRPLVRVVNSGISEVVGPGGRVFAETNYRESVVLPVTLKIISQNPTFYSQYGFLLALLVPTSIGVFFIRHTTGHPAEFSRFVINRGRTALLCGWGAIALSYSVGYVVKSDTLQALGIASGSSPNPFVFNSFKGIDYWANIPSLELLTTKARRIAVPVNAELFSKLEGQHHYHVAAIIPFAFAPVSPRELWEPLARAFFCDGNQQTIGFIAEALESDERVASMRLDISSNPRSSSSRKWNFRILCSPGDSTR